MSELSPRQIEELREELERALRKLERSLRTSSEAARPVQLDQSAVGRLSRMDALQNQSMSQGLQEREQARLAQLTAALGRLEEGTYGACAACGEPIPFERLLIFPETETCARCAATDR